MATNRAVVLLYIICFSVTGRLVEALTADDVFDYISWKFYVFKQDIDSVKSSVAQIKTDVSRIEKGIENVKKNVSEIIHIAEAKEERISKSGVQDKINRQSRAVQKMLATEKIILREAVDNLQDMFSDLQSDIKSRMSSMNFSVGNSIKEIQNSVSDHIAHTYAKLREMDTELTLRMKQTEIRIDEMRQEVKQMTTDALRRVNGIGESIKATAKQDVSNAKNEFRYKLSSEISKVTSQLTSLEREHERHEDEVDDNIADLKRKISNQESYTSGLSKRMSAEEERKVSFFARPKFLSGAFKSEPVIFQEVIHNQGGGYNPSTGIFTAPKSGIYVFGFYVVAIEPTLNMDVEPKFLLYVDGQTRAIQTKHTNDHKNIHIEFLWEDEEAWVQAGSSVDMIILQFSSYFYVNLLQ